MPESNITELDAVNQMLLTIGEQKVNSLESSGVLEVNVAKSTLDEVSRVVQGEGWHFNTEHGVRLMPNTDGHIVLPQNCLRAWMPPRTRPEIIQRGTRMYNKTDHSYEFKHPLCLSIMYFLDFEELLPAARLYITLRACRRFQERLTGSQVTEEFVMREEAMVRAQLEAADASNAGYSIIWDNRPTVDIHLRDRWGC